jgi:hypothetical protein
MRIKSLFILAVLMIIGCSNMLAQVAVPVNTSVWTGKIAPFPPGSIIEGKPVKNAPYSAEAVNESETVLADGGRIFNKEVTKFFRDSEGRTRREIVAGNPRYMVPIDTTLPFRAEIRFESGIQISDPVSGFVYKLEPQTHTAKKHKMVMAEEFFQRVKITQPNESALNSEKKIATTGDEGNIIFKTLGKQIIEGVECNGKLIQTTIPAGQIGNDKPIIITEESWYSPTLQSDVLRRRYDPRTGKSFYKLENLNQSEPAASLFQVPPDYKIIDASEEANGAGEKNPFKP